MHLLNELNDLHEKLTAQVHTSLDKKLHVIANLVDTKFGLYFDKIYGGCLASQMIFTMSSVANVNPHTLTDALNRSAVSSGHIGPRLKDLWKVFHNKPIKVGSEVLTFKLSVHAPTLAEAVESVKQGQPTVFIPSIAIQDAISDQVSLEEFDPDGVIELSDAILASPITEQRTFHAFLIIGYDVDGYLIVRDARSVYSFKGYAKLPYKQLEAHPNAYKLLEIAVDDLARKPA